MKNLKFLSPKEEKAVKEFCKSLRTKYKKRVKFIRIFGSKVHGKSDKFSDIDIFILLDKKDKRIGDYISRAAWERSLKYDVVLSPIVYEERLFRRPVIQITPFIKNVLKEGAMI
ncbi:hypothetical protein ES703_42493 [subsurface metagenome]